MTCRPCLVTYQGVRYHVEQSGAVRPTWILTEPVRDGQAQPTGKTMQTRQFDAPVDAELAKHIRAEAARQRRNRTARERHDVMTTLGLVRTRSGQYE